MDTLLFAINAILPIILLIVLGYILKRIKFLSEDFFRKGNKFVFRVCLPCLLFINVYNIESFSSINWSVVLYSEIAIIAFFLIGLIVVKFGIKDDARKGVVLQCVFRSNFAIIGLPLAASLGGEAGKGIAAVLSAFSIPTFNILAVIALSIFKKAENGKISIKDTLLKIIKNPLIIGVVSGLIVLGIRSFIPTESITTITNVIDESGNIITTSVITKELKFSLKNDLVFLYKSIDNISKIASPLALIILGGLFDFKAVKGMIKEIIIGTSARVLLVPLVVISLAAILSKYTNILNFDNSVYPALFALFGSPVAVSSAIMAAEMENDGELAGQLVVWTSLCSILTVFLFVIVMKHIGLL